MSAIFNKAKDYYLKAIDWIDTHPHMTLWSALAVMAVLLVL